MADTSVTVVGNLVDNPELRFTPNGVPVGSLRIAVNSRVRQGDEWVDGPASFYDVTVWRGMAENAAESLAKGNRVVITGTLQQRRWEDNEGNPRSKVEITADEVAPSLKWAIAKPRRSAPNSQPETEGNGSRKGRPQRSAASSRRNRTTDTTVTTGGDFDQEPPF